MSDDVTFEQAQVLAAYKRLFLKTEDGKIVLQDLATRGMLDKTVLTSEPHLTYFNEGRRSMVLEIFTALHTNVVEFLSSGMTLEDV